MRTTYVWRDGKLVEKSDAPPLSGITIIRDTPGCVDPIEGKWLEGRAARREFMKRHDVVEADPSLFKNKGWESPRNQRRFGDPRERD